jgi:hypothetical protein
MINCSWRSRAPGILFVVALVVFGGCFGGHHKSVVPDESIPDINGEGYNHFVNADLLEIIGLFPQALQEYENALHLSAFGHHSNRLRSASFSPAKERRRA